MPRPASVPRPLAGRADWKHLHCSFCGKDAEHVRFLTAGIAGGKICDVCCLQAFVIFLKAWLTPWRRPAAH